MSSLSVISYQCVKEPQTEVEFLTLNVMSNGQPMTLDVKIGRYEKRPNFNYSTGGYLCDFNAARMQNLLHAVVCAYHNTLKVPVTLF